MLRGLQSHRITIIAPVVKCSFGFHNISRRFEIYLAAQQFGEPRKLRQASSLCPGKSPFGKTLVKSCFSEVEGEGRALCCTPLVYSFTTGIFLNQFNHLTYSVLILGSNECR